MEGIPVFLMGLYAGWGAIKEWQRYRSLVEELSGNESSGDFYMPAIAYNDQAGAGTAFAGRFE